MILENVLTRLNQKLANDEIGLAIQKCDAEAGELALTCIKNKRANPDSADILGSAKENILKFVDSAKNKINSTPGGKMIAAGAGGAALGSLFGNISSSKNEFETDEDFKKRKRQSTMSGLIAGGILGASTPTLLSGLNSVKESVKPGEPTTRESIKNVLVNPTTIGMTGGTAAGYAIEKLKAIADKGLLAKDPTPIQHNIAVGNHSYLNDLPDSIKGSSIAQKINKFPFIKKILMGVTKRKFMLPAAGAVALPAAANAIFGGEVFDKPVFEQ